MLRIIVLTLLFIASCSVKVFPEEKITLRALDAKVDTSYTGEPIRLGDIETTDMFATEKIMYKEKDRFGYFAKSKWSCPPDCMFERLLLREFSYIGDKGKSELSLKILDLYVDFSEEKPKVIFTVRAELRKGSKTTHKLFHFERESGNSEEEIFGAFNVVTQDFLKGLDLWLKEINEKD